MTTGATNTTNIKPPPKPTANSTSAKSANAANQQRFDTALNQGKIQNPSPSQPPLEQLYNDFERFDSAGQQDGAITRDDLKAVTQGQDYSAEQKASAQYLLDNNQAFTDLDRDSRRTGRGVKSHLDGKIEQADILARGLGAEVKAGSWQSTGQAQDWASERLVTARQNGDDPGLDRAQSKAVFQTVLKDQAIERLDQNRARLDSTEQSLQQALSDSPETWDRLRSTIEADQTLAAKQRELERQLEPINITLGQSYGISRWFGGNNSLEQKQQDLKNRIALVGDAREKLRANNPALAVLNTDKLDLNKLDNPQLFGQIQSDFNAVRGHLDKAEQKIRSGDMPLSELGPVVGEVKQQFNINDNDENVAGDTFGNTAQSWLRDEKLSENIISYGGTALSLGLGLASIPASGGTSLLLGLGGAAAGFGTAAYEFERADDLYTAAKAGEGGGQQLIDDPQQAEFNRTMGFVNLAIATVDLGVAFKAGSTLLKGGKAAQELVDATGEMFAKLSPEAQKALQAVPEEDLASVAGLYKDSPELVDDLLKQMTFKGEKAARKGGPAYEGTTDALQKLSTSIDNYNIVKQRGYPFGFDSLQEFQDYKNTITEGLEKYGIPAEDVRIQGSAVHSQTPGDIDVIVAVDEEKFNQLAQEFTELSNKAKVRKSIAKEAEKGKIPSYRFATEPRPDQTIGQSLHDANELKTQVSLIRKGSEFDLGPFLEF